jgi:hypothetical protein
MPDWKLQGHELVWDAEAPDPVGVEGSQYTYPRPAEGELLAHDFDPSDHTIEEIKKYVGDYPDEAQRIYDAEYGGKARQTLLDWLTAD